MVNSLIHTVYNYVYDISTRSPRWKRLLFKYVYCPFNEFFHEWLGFVAYTHEDADGRKCWLERQGPYSEAWRARQEADKYPFGFVITLALDEDQPTDSVKPAQYHANSNTVMYERISRAAETQRLMDKIRSTDAVVNANPL